MMKDLTYNHIIIYPKIYLIYYKLIVENKFNIKIILAAGVISDEIINKF